MTAATADPVSPGTLIPDLLKSHPAARVVLDRYGLKGCGGPDGPRETLEFFARAHDVPLVRLLAEIGEAVPGARPSGEHAPVRWSADGIYRPFFLTGIAVVLTLGASWGAYLLARIAVAGSFTGAGLHAINAHGHAQVFGWVGLFVMGFAYQAFPRFKHTELRHPRLAWLSFALMLTGVLLRSTLEPLADGWGAAAAAAVAGSGLEAVAVGLFVGVLAATWRASGKPLAGYDWYVASALFWLAVMTVYEGVYAAATFRAAPGELVPLVAAWQGALRDIQIHGFATLMILGVSQRLLPHMLNFPAGSPRLARWCLVGLNLAVAGEAVGLVLMRLDGRAWAGLWYGSVLLLAGCVVLLVRNWGVFGPAEGRDRSRKFVRAAYAWLLVSLAMLVALPAYQFAALPAINPGAAAVKTGFSHAYYGAARHAITVGFVSLMIVGVASKVVPTLRGADPTALTRLWVPFALINLGCSLRVVGQTATDWADWVFPLAGVSGVLEVTGLAVWGATLPRLMLRPAGWEAADPARGGPIRAGDSVAGVLARHPELLPVFLDWGFKPLANPVLRRTAARGVTVALACRIVGVDGGDFLAALNAGRSVPGTGRSLPLIELDHC
jgi:hypothetical protein